MELFGQQMFGSWRALAVTAGVVTVLGLIPGMPHLVFLTIGGLIGYFAWWLRQVRLRDAAAATTTPSIPSGNARRAYSRAWAESRFVPVRVVPSPSRGACHFAPIEIVLGESRRVRVAAGFDSDTLAEVVRLLEALPC